MSARNMVRNLRDSGALAVAPPPPAWRSTVLLFAGAVCAGALAYLGVIYGVPALVDSFDRPPPPVSFAKH